MPKIQYYEIVDVNEKGYVPPWLMLMKALSTLRPQDRRLSHDTMSVHWRQKGKKASAQDAVVELARDRVQNPAINDINSGSTSPAPVLGQNRAYAERVIIGLVDDRVVGCLRLGSAAAQAHTAVANINVMLHLQDPKNPHSARPMFFRRILSPGFVERLRRRDTLVVGIELHGRFSGVRNMMGGGVLARSNALQRANPEGLKASVAISLDTKKRLLDNLSEAEKEEAAVLFEEALELVQNAAAGVSGRIMTINPHGRDPVHIGDAHLETEAPLPRDTGAYPDAITVLDAMHAGYAPLASQVRSNLRP